MKSVVRRKWILLFLVGAALCGFAATIAALERGPYVCNNGCSVQSPLIDAKTAAYLDSVLAPIDRAPFAMYLSGTTYMICNATHCTTYHQTFDGKYIGEGRTPIQGGGGGGSGAGGSGGVPGGGQSGGACDPNTQSCGKVEVGKPRNA